MRELINLLVVDDNTDFLELIHDMLVEEEWSVKAVENVRSAESILNQFDVDAIICDYMLPEYNGLELLRRIRSEGLSTPFILISGAVDEDVLSLGLKLGAFDVLSKPLPLDSIRNSISKAVKSGIQQRLTNERLRAHLNSEDLKIVMNGIRTVSMLRASNTSFPKKKKAVA